LLAGLFDRRLRPKLLELQLDGGQIRVDRFVQQVHLLTAELFAAPAKLLTPEDRDLVGQLVDTGLSVMQLAFVLIDLPRLLRNLPVSLLDLGNQLRCEGAQLFGAEGVEVSGQVHANQSARTPDTVEAELFTSLWASNDADHTVWPDALPRQTHHQTPELFLR